MIGWLKKKIRNLVLKQMLKSKGVRTMLTKIRKWLSGKKTYFAATIILSQGIVQFINDGDFIALLKSAGEALAIAGIKAAIVKS